MNLESIIQLITQAERIVGFTGAGISTESGIPDFRSPNGVWSKNRTVYFDEFVNNIGDRIEYWRQKSEAWPDMRDAVPNAGHHAFVELERRGKLRALVTQNIDGLHHRAGNSTEKIIELHGTTVEVECLDCRDRISMDAAVARIAAGDLTPDCEKCGGILKPATISFGQAMPVIAMKRAEQACDDCDVFIAVGSSLVVHPAASLPVLAKENGAALIIINRTPTPLDEIADLVLHEEISVALPKLICN